MNIIDSLRVKHNEDLSTMHTVTLNLLSLVNEMLHSLASPERERVGRGGHGSVVVANDEVRHWCDQFAKISEGMDDD